MRFTAPYRGRPYNTVFLLSFQEGQPDRDKSMLKSEHRILTTHTGSLPRPLELTSLYAKRSLGEAVDAAALDAAGKGATRHVVRKQREAGIDIGNNGEQQREAFFLYVRHRMSGFGGGWHRKPFADPPEDNGPDLTSEPIRRVLSALKVLDRYESRAAARRDKIFREIILNRSGIHLHL